jgi:predicted RNA-binding Zn-ribbon protein involved in translation (DUF1610 family)
MEEKKYNPMLCRLCGKELVFMPAGHGRRHRFLDDAWLCDAAHPKIRPEASVVPCPYCGKWLYAKTRAHKDRLEGVVCKKARGIPGYEQG